MHTHRLFLNACIAQLPDALTVDGTEAAHAVLVKRLVPGDLVALRDGIGGHASATVTAVHRLKRDTTLSIAISKRGQAPRPTPAVHVFSAVPKGDRAAQLIDQLSQVGATSWRWLRTTRAVAEATDHKLDRLHRVAVEAAKQCGRAWLLNIEPPITIADAIAWGTAPGRKTFLASADGQPFADWAATVRATTIAPPLARPAQQHASTDFALLIGPEGGFDNDELAALAHAHARALCFGPHVMRTETAAVAAAHAMVLALGTAEPIQTSHS